MNQPSAPDDVPAGDELELKDGERCRARPSGPRFTLDVSPSANKLLEEALSLGEAERASLAGALIESLEGPAEEGAAEAWEQVIERRVRELESGSVETIPWSEVRARLFRRYE